MTTQQNQSARWHLVGAIALAAVVGLVSTAVAQDAGDAPKPDDPPPTIGTRQGPDVGREGMWPAPTDEDWAKPVLITFQRSWDDALAISKETNRAILCCINMDGEIASEHYAGVRYRQSDVAALYAPYVCVIASVYRHNPRDYDDAGNRILCPRFGSVTCGEHIAIEPILYEKYLNGDRVAPRHIMVELDGSESYDMYYINDTASVFDGIREGITNRNIATTPVVRGDRPAVERVGSRAIQDREVVEKAYRNGDAAARRALLEQALANADADPVELLRLAVFGLDSDLSKVARKGLTDATSAAATDLIAEALRVPMDTAERDALITALERIGATSRRAAWLATVQRGLSGGTSEVDPERWKAALSRADPVVTQSYERHALEQSRSRRNVVARERPEDPIAQVELAEATLELALRAESVETENPKHAKALQKLLYHDARTAALAAEKLGSTDWRISAVLSRAAYFEGDVETAYARAETAVKAMPSGETGWNAATVLTIFGESRFKAIKSAVKQKQKWSPEWLADLHAAYTVLLQHPRGTVEQALWYYDFLDWLRARHRAGTFLEAAVVRFPGSTVLHQRLRIRQLRTRGIGNLEATYTRLMEQSENPGDLAWFAGYASMVAADVRRRTRNGDKAVAAYGRAIAHFEAAIANNALSRISSDNYIALMLAGRARVKYQQSDDDAALSDVLASFARSPSSAGTRDGVGITPGETAQMLLARLKSTERTEQVAQLEEALGKIDPELLLPDRP